MRSPAPSRQRFRVGIDEIPDDVLEQIAHAGDCGATTWAMPADNLPDFAHPDNMARARRWFATIEIAPANSFTRRWHASARWAALLLGVEVK